MSNATHKSVILYVDDDADDCIFLKTSLEDAGSKAKLICANDGEEAVGYLNSITPDALPSLIVLDLNMPRWGGRKTLNYLKSHPQLASIPVVIFSTHESEKEREACRQLGAVSYFKKPFNFNDYKGIVAGFFSVMKD
jgi:CheY-like chemotaxis protein